MNIIVSGWPGVGSSTNAKLLSYIFNLRYIYVGGIVKFLAQKMGYNSKTKEFIIWSEKYLNDWDYIWENFILEEYKNFENTVIDAKLLGFFINEKVVKKIFIIASRQARMKRFASDKRKILLNQRDKILELDWKKRYNIDFFDLNFIKQHYDFILDTSNLNITKAGIRVCEYIKGKKLDQNEIQKIQYIGDKFFKIPGILDTQLEKINLIIPGYDIIKIIATKYKKLLGLKINKELKDAIFEIANEKFS